MADTIIFDGVDLSAYGVRVSNREALEIAKRSQSFAARPGRTGDALLDGTYVSSQDRTVGGTVPNITLTYQCSISTGAEEQLREIRDILGSRPGYRRIQDSIFPGEYRMGVWDGAFSPKASMGRRAANFEISFRCLPQRFLTSGEEPKYLLRSSGVIYVPTGADVSYGGTRVIQNPYRTTALPKIRIWPTDSSLPAHVTIDGAEITVSGAPYESVLVDCEAGICTGGGTGAACGAYVSITREGEISYDFPKLRPGTNTLTLGTGCKAVEVTPNWWRW